MKPLAWLTSLSLMLIVPRSPILACNTIDLLTERSANNQELMLPLGRPSTQEDWITPDGRFHIHYDLSGQNAVYHPEEDVNPPDGIPDYVNRTADYLSLAYDSLVIAIGFDPPPFDGTQGGDSLYDIYLTENPGLTTPEAPSNQYPGRPAYSSFIQLGHDLRYPARYGDDPLPFLKASVAHEFFHAIEFAYRAYSSSEHTYWWFEACANWAEEHVFDDLNDVYYSLPGYLSRPYLSLYNTPGPFIYGAWLWPEYLDERFGTAFLISCWEKFSGFDFAITATSFALREIGADIAEEYSFYAIWNYFTGHNWRDGFYQEGAAFDTTVHECRRHDSYPVDWIDGPYSLGNMSSSYIVFEHAGPPKVSLVIDYFNPNPDRQAVGLAIVRPGAPVQFGVYYIDSGVPQTFIVPEFGAVDKVVMIPVWIFEGSPQYDSTAYRYRAYLQNADAVADNDGPMQGYALNGSYPNPFNGAATISFYAPDAQPYTIRIYDIVGRTILTSDGVSHQGLNTLTWQSPSDLASGVLFYVIDFGQRELKGKMSLLK
jgi:hypothetical protein